MAWMRDITRRARDWVERLSTNKLEPSRTRSILLYLFFVFISALLWCFLTFNKPITRDMPVLVKLQSCPDNVRFITPLPDTLTVTVTARGTTFIKHLFRQSSTLNLRFGDYRTDEDIIKVDASRLKRLLIAMMGRDVTVHSVQPESLTAKFTDSPGKRVPVIVRDEIKPAQLFVRNGPLIKSVDSVMVYGSINMLANITEVYTYHIKETGLTDTLRRRVSIQPLRDALVEPRSIEITVPIEKMIGSSQKVQIQVMNAPEGVKVIVFPASVNVSYRVPKSLQKTPPKITAYVDYNDLDPARTAKAKVTLAELPEEIRRGGCTLSVDSVEYIIQKL